MYGEEKSEAAQCRRKGWLPGTVLIGDEGHGPERIVITALSLHAVIAMSERAMHHDGLWTLTARRWRKIGEIDITKPLEEWVWPEDPQRRHELKTWLNAFESVMTGVKTAEYRKNDRDYNIGDVLTLREWDPGAPTPEGSGQYTGREVMVIVTHILRGPQFEVPEGYAVMSIRLRGEED